MSYSATFKVTTPSDREIVMTRMFDAPRTLVFDCWTKPELLKRWMTGPPGWIFEVCEIDLRVGGAYRFVWRRPEGAAMGMGGVHLEIVPPERVVNTQLFDQDWTGGETIGTLVLTEHNGKTTATNTVLYSSKQARDGALQSGMEHGMRSGYDQLDHVLASLVEATGFRTAITATLSVRDWSKAVDFYKNAFGATELYRVEGGGVSRLAVSGAEFWVAEESREHKNFSPQTLGGCSVRMMLIVQDPASVCKQAVAAGATQVVPVEDNYGWRIGRIEDPFGHHWEVAREVACG